MDKLSSYSNRFEYGCSDQTPISTNTFLKFVNKSINKNLFEKNIPGLSLSLDKTEIEDNESAIKLLSEVLKKLKSSNNK